MVGRVEIAGMARGNRICREGERNEQKRIHRRFGRRGVERLIGNNLGPWERLLKPPLSCRCWRRSSGSSICALACIST